MCIASKNGEFPLIEFNLKLLRRIRLWNETPGQRIPSFGLLIVILFPIGWLIPSWLFILSSHTSVTRLMKGVNEQIVFFIVFTKLFFYAIHFRRWEQLFYDLQSAYSSVMNNPGIQIQKIIGHVKKSTHILTKCYICVVSFNCAAYGIFPMLYNVVKYAITGTFNVPLSTPIEANYFIPGCRTKFWVWLPLDVTLNVLLEFHSLSLLFIECFSWSLVYATSCMFRILQVLAKELLQRTRDKEEWEIELKKFVHLHDLTLRSAGTLEDILCQQMLLLYISTIFAICLCMVVLSLANNEVHLLLTTFVVFGYCIFQMFTFSYLGTEVIEQSGAVSDAIFHSKWYEQDVKKWKDLCIVMLRAKKPVTLTAAKLFVVTRDSFTQVIKQAYTIFTLMSQFLDDTAN